MIPKRREKWESKGQGILAQSGCCQYLGWTCWKGSEPWMMSMKCIHPRPGDGAASPAEPMAVSGEHSCVLPLLPYTFIPETLAHKEGGAMAVSVSRACGIMYVLSLSLLHQGKVFSAPCFSEYFWITFKASPSRSK